MKRYILFIITLMACSFVQAQDAFLIHFKDGTTQRIPHGIYSGILRTWGTETEELEFDGFTPLENDDPWAGLTGNVAKNEDDFLTAMWKDHDGQFIYTVLLLIPATAPTSLPYSFCMSTSPGVDLVHADTVLTLYKPKGYEEQTDVICSVGLGERLVNDYGNGAGILNGLHYSWGNISPNNFRIPLVHGTTYYYRLVAHIPTLRQGGLRDTLTVYGPELSFRIPDFVGESGVVPARMDADGILVPTSDAWAAFKARSFDVGLVAPADSSLCELWVEWTKTEGGRQATESLSRTSHHYDDVLVYFCDTVPDAFLPWLQHRELVFTQEEDFIVAQGVTNEGLKPIAAKEYVDDSASTWGNPSGHFIRFSPINLEGQKATTNATTLISLRQIIPDVSYRMTVTLAPETDTLSHAPLPYRMRIWRTTNSLQLESGLIPSSTSMNDIYNVTDVLSSTEPHILTFEFEPNKLLNQILVVQTNNTVSAVARQRAISEFRIAEIRLTPIESDEGD